MSYCANVTAILWVISHAPHRSTELVYIRKFYCAWQRAGGGGGRGGQLAGGGATAPLAPPPLLPTALQTIQVDSPWASPVLAIDV